MSQNFETTNIEFLKERLAQEFEQFNNKIKNLEETVGKYKFKLK
jgi:hypothetical protein